MKARLVGRCIVALSTVIVALAVSHGGTHSGVANAKSSTITFSGITGDRGNG